MPRLMPGKVNSVLDNSPRLTQSSYRKAVREVVKTITENTPDPEAAEILRCCKQTIRNARDMVGDLKAITLLRIAAAHGPERLKPVTELIGMGLAWTIPPADETTDREKESRVLSAALALSVALADGKIEDGEIDANRATIENAITALRALLDRPSSSTSQAPRLRTVQPEGVA
jgi:hypothetical protein